MILVTGATGNIGRELVGTLAERDVPVRALVRDPARAADLPARVERVVGDLGQPDRLRDAFAGVRGLFLLTAGIGTEYTANALAAAEAAAVERIVAVSSFFAASDPVPAMGRWHHERELLVRAAGIPATTLRPGGLMSNALAWAPIIRADGHLLDPLGPGRLALIDPADIALIAARALTEDGHAGLAYTLTGEQALTFAEQVAILGAALGRELKVREVATAEEAVRARYPNGAPKELADAVVEAFLQGRADTVGFRTDTARELLGRSPRTFADWCARNVERFR